MALPYRYRCNVLDLKMFSFDEWPCRFEQDTRQCVLCEDAPSDSARRMVVVQDIFAVILPPPSPGLAPPAMPMYQFGIEYIRSALMTLPCDTSGAWVISEIDSYCSHTCVCLAPEIWT